MLSVEESGTRMREWSGLAGRLALRAIKILKKCEICPGKFRSNVIRIVPYTTVVRDAPTFLANQH